MLYFLFTYMHNCCGCALGFERWQNAVWSKPLVMCYFYSRLCRLGCMWELKLRAIIFQAFIHFKSCYKIYKHIVQKSTANHDFFIFCFQGVKVFEMVIRDNSSTFWRSLKFFFGCWLLFFPLIFTLVLVHGHFLKISFVCLLSYLTLTCKSSLIKRHLSQCCVYRKLSKENQFCLVFLGFFYCQPAAKHICVICVIHFLLESARNAEDNAVWQAENHISALTSQ